MAGGRQFARHQLCVVTALILFAQPAAPSPCNFWDRAAKAAALSDFQQCSGVRVSDLVNALAEDVQSVQLDRLPGNIKECASDPRSCVDQQAVEALGSFGAMFDDPEKACGCAGSVLDKLPACDEEKELGLVKKILHGASDICDMWSCANGLDIEQTVAALEVCPDFLDNPAMLCTMSASDQSQCQAASAEMEGTVDEFSTCMKQKASNDHQLLSKYADDLSAEAFFTKVRAKCEQGAELKWRDLVPDAAADFSRHVEPLKLVCGDDIMRMCFAQENEAFQLLRCLMDHGEELGDACSAAFARLPFRHHWRRGRGHRHHDFGPPHHGRDSHHGDGDHDHNHNHDHDHRGPPPPRPPHRDGENCVRMSHAFVSLSGLARAPSPPAMDALARSLVEPIARGLGVAPEAVVVRPACGCHRDDDDHHHHGSGRMLHGHGHDGHDHSHDHGHNHDHDHGHNHDHGHDHGHGHGHGGHDEECQDGRAKFEIVVSMCEGTGAGSSSSSISQIVTAFEAMKSGGFEQELVALRQCEQCGQQDAENLAVTMEGGLEEAPADGGSNDGNRSGGATPTQRRLRRLFPFVLGGGLLAAVAAFFVQRRRTAALQTRLAYEMNDARNLATPVEGTNVAGMDAAAAVAASRQAPLMLDAASFKEEQPQGKPPAEEQVVSNPMIASAASEGDIDVDAL